MTGDDGYAPSAKASWALAASSIVAELPIRSPSASLGGAKHRTPSTSVSIFHDVNKSHHSAESIHRWQKQAANYARSTQGAHCRRNNSIKTLSRLDAGQASWVTKTGPNDFTLQHPFLVLAFLEQRLSNKPMPPSLGLSPTPRLSKREPILVMSPPKTLKGPGFTKPTVFPLCRS